MGRFLCVVLLSSTCLLMSNGLVQATLTSLDSTYGPNTLTYDSQTGLMWLDVDLTKGRSYNDISSKFGPGGEFAGFRYTTASELSTLFSHADSQTATGFLALQALVGVTNLTSSQSWTTGVAGFSESAGSHKLSSIRVFLSGSYQLYVTNGGNQADASGHHARGHWLVSETLVSVEDKTWGSIKGLYR